MILYAGQQISQDGEVQSVDQHHAMGIAHRQGSDVECSTIDSQRWKEEHRACLVGIQDLSRLSDRSYCAGRGSGVRRANS